MEFKVVISDPKTGRSYQREIKGNEAARLRNKKIGDEFDGDIVGLKDYKLKITGGSDRGGFPMKKGLHSPVGRVLMSEGVGYRTKEKIRKRKRLRGELITDAISQINTKIVSEGKKKIEEVLGIKVEGKMEEKKEEPKRKTEEKPKVEEERNVEAEKQKEKGESKRNVQKVKEEKPKEKVGGGRGEETKVENA